MIFLLPVPRLSMSHFSCPQLFCPIRGVFRRGGLWGLSTPPRPGKYMDFRGFSSPNGCWAPSPPCKQKSLSSPWRNSWIHPCVLCLSLSHLFLVLSLSCLPFVCPTFVMYTTFQSNPTFREVLISTIQSWDEITNSRLKQGLITCKPSDYSTFNCFSLWFI